MGYIKIITAILLWSSLGIFIRKVEIPLLGLVFYPAAISGVIQLIFISSTGNLKQILKAESSSHRGLLFILVPVCTAANTFLFYFAFTHTTIANAVLSHYTAPIFVALMAPIFLKEQSHKTTWIAILLSSFGLWIMLWMPSSGGSVSMSAGERQGIIAGACSGFAYACIILMLRTLASKYMPIVIIFIQSSMVAIFLLPFVLNISVPAQSLPYLFILGVVHSIIAPLLYTQGFKSVRANEAAILGYFEPVGATLLAFVFLHEAPGIAALIGGALIMLSGYLILKGRPSQVTANKKSQHRM
jgi:drug/metabolite transporter (DMT)-like permease